MTFVTRDWAIQNILFGIFKRPNFLVSDVAKKRRFVEQCQDKVASSAVLSPRRINRSVSRTIIELGQSTLWRENRRQYVKKPLVVSCDDRGWILISSPQLRRRSGCLHYAATLEPDIAGKSVKGTVRIRFSTDSQQAEFNCGDLAIDSVRLADTPLKFSVARPSTQRHSAVTNHTHAGDRDRLSRHAQIRHSIFPGSPTGLHDFFHQPMDGLR